MLVLKLVHLVCLAVTFLTANCPLVPINYRWACKWLYYYLQGSGKTRNIPTDLIKDLLPSLLWEQEEGTILFHNTSFYEGYGFEGRPPLFYMIGCFTANVKKVVDGYQLQIEDVYDWHSTKVSTGEYHQVETVVSFELEEESSLDEAYLEWDYELSRSEKAYCIKPEIELILTQYSYDVMSYEEIMEERWHCSSIPCELPDWVHNVLHWLLPKYYVLKGWPMGNKGFTNQLWYDLQLVGAKPFTSVFNGIVKVYR